MPIQLAEALAWEQEAAQATEVDDGTEAPPVAEVPAAGPANDSALASEVEQIVGWFREAGRALRASDPANWAEGLTMPQLRVLFFLGRTGPAPVGEVAAGLGVAQPSATETLDRLVRAGYVERAADTCDRRVVRTALSPAGRELIDRAWETRRAVLASALRHASLQDRAAIARGLETLCRVLVEDAGSAGQEGGAAPLAATGVAAHAAGREWDSRPRRDQRGRDERRDRESASPVGERKKERRKFERSVAPG